MSAAGIALCVGALVLAAPIQPGQGTVLGGLGVLAAGGLTFYASNRARASTERIEGDKAAQSAAELDQARAQFERQHEFEQTRADAERRSATERELRARFTASASQLADTSPTIRLAGVYSLVALGDDWYAHGSEDEREVCVELLASYLRTPQSNPEPDDGDAAPHVHVRATIARVIADRRLAPTHLPTSWSDVRAATLARADLRHADLRGTAMTNIDLEGALMIRADLSHADLRGANLQSADLTKATLQATQLSGAEFWMTKLDDAQLVEATLDDTEVRLSMLRNADLSYASLRRATFIASNLTDTAFYQADVRGALLGRAKLSSVDLSSITYDDATVWPHGFTPPGPSVPRDEGRI